MPDNTDLLAIFAHPDDAELLAGGTLIKAVDQGHLVAAIDLTRGELGSRGTAEIRAREAAAAAAVMGLVSRESLDLGDGRLANDDATRRAVVEAIRRHRPRVVVTHYSVGRHPDHRAAAELVRDAAFLAGLANYPADGERHRPDKLCFAFAYREDTIKPTFVVDTTAQFERKLEAMRCFASQWDSDTRQAGEVNPTGQQLWELVRTHDARAGSLIRVGYGEPFWTAETVPIGDITTLGASTL
jgi:bacillithiol biosynthesis deacetylase BshB1